MTLTFKKLLNLDGLWYPLDSTHHLCKILYLLHQYNISLTNGKFSLILPRIILDLANDIFKLLLEFQEDGYIQRWDRWLIRIQFILQVSSPTINLREYASNHNDNHSISTFSPTIKWLYSDINRSIDTINWLFWIMAIWNELYTWFAEKTRSTDPIDRNTQSSVSAERWVWIWSPK